jgi:transglutaminase/protease-like cytokinesis protein 3
MGVEAYRVVGYSKAGDFVKGVTPTSSDHAWNVIQIYGNYYLLDATWGIGSCNGDAYVPKLRDSYFCTKPEAFIRTHLPVEKKYQLVYPTITLKQWSNMLEVNMEFYESGMTEISPDKAILEIDNGKIEVEITYEPPEEPLGFLYHLYHLQVRLMHKTVRCMSILDRRNILGCA